MLSAVVFLLLIPLVAMQFSTAVNWIFSDFLVAALLLVGTVFIYELVLRKVKTMKVRLALCATLGILLLLIWAELAVGIFGTPLAGN